MRALTAPAPKPRGATFGTCTTRTRQTPRDAPKTFREPQRLGERERLDAKSSVSCLAMASRADLSEEKTRANKVCVWCQKTVPLFGYVAAGQVN